MQTESPLLTYLAGLKPDELTVAIEALPPHQKDVLISDLLQHLGTMTRSIVGNAEQLWDNAT